MEEWPKYEVSKYGNKYWKNEEGLLHREDGPAVEYKNGDKEWWINGEYHREGGPAIEYVNGNKSYYIDGLKHREDGPAIEKSNGVKEYWINGIKVEEKDLPINKWPKMKINEYGNKEWKNKKGEYHREDGPAIEWVDGTKLWYKDGMRHREDGPAVEYTNGDKAYYLNGNEVEEKDLPINQWPKCIIDESGSKYWENEKGEFHREGNPAIEWADGGKSWWVNGKLHREDGPAKEYANGDKTYWINGIKVEEKDLPINQWPKCEINKYGNKVWKNKEGLLHKEDGPAWEWENGDKEWYRNGKRHREGGPACEYVNGNKEWWINDKLHREDGPAREYSSGNKYWYKDGLFHREDGPAVEIPGGDKYWYKEGILHREDGPAIEYADGGKSWWINGKLHREDGPAKEYANGDKTYWINGIKVEEKDLPINKWPKMKINEFGNEVWENEEGKLHRLDGAAIKFTDGAIGWYKNGEKHRLNGPAIEWPNGNKEYWINGIKVEEKDLPINQWPKCTIDKDGNKEWRNEDGKWHREDGPARDLVIGIKEWFINGKLHREDGPAVEFANGDKIWYINGKFHREDGPAREFADGCKEYWINGDKIEERDFLMKKDEIYLIRKVDEKGNIEWQNEKGQLHRLDGPAIELANGYKEWYKDGLCHREDGPAREYPDGTKAWYKNGLRDRTDGPAFERDDGYKEYWINNKKVEEKDLPINKKEEPICIIDISGNKTWCNINGEKHREDGPAKEFANGSKEWWINGKLHRENGPARDLVTGIKEWFINGNLHREDGPACEYASGIKYYYLYGKLVEEKDLPINKEKESLIDKEWPKCTIDKNGNKEWRNEMGYFHREDGAAAEYTNGNKFWYKDGLRHREDGPACEYSDGDKFWYIKGKLHREGGPALEFANGNKEYWVGGNLHRMDGPAIEYMNGNKFYYINGIRVEEKDLPINKKDEGSKCSIDEHGNKKWYKNEELHREDGPAIEWFNGSKAWYINGKCHREDGPAIEFYDGSKHWYKNGKMHREDGPATEEISGKKYWYKNDKLHREGGPAVEWDNGDKYWYREGLRHREDGPACEYANGNKVWYINGGQIEEKDLPINKAKELIKKKCPMKWWANKEGQWHREDGPAIESADGDKEWYINGKRHREDGPAIERADGYKEYWINNKKIEEKDLPINKSTNALDIIKADSKKALYRTINKQGIKLIKNSIIKLMESKNIKSDQIKAIGKFLNTEVGYGLISFILGEVLTYTPRIKENKYIGKISKEMRVDGIAGVGQFITKEILEIIIKGNQVSKIRIQENLEKENEEQMEDEEGKAELTIN